MMLSGCVVDQTVLGGPSYGVLNHGDLIVKVEDEEVEDATIVKKLRGSDKPGSAVAVTYKKGGSVSLRRSVQ